MIIKGLFDLIAGVINLIPFELPQLPDQFQTILDMLFDGIISSLGILNLFINIPFWIKCAVAMTIVVNIKHIWNTFIWLLNLIPSVNISYWK